jgi:hypothetical protein
MNNHCEKCLYIEGEGKRERCVDCPCHYLSKEWKTGFWNYMSVCLGENKTLYLQNEYSQKRLFDFIRSEKAQLIEKVDWILTPHGFESDDPKMEEFARKLKEKLRKEIHDKLR